jgi:hypothetical protein
MTNTIIWDMDGTLSYDDGKYDHDKEWTPLLKLLRILQTEDTENILVTGSEHIPIAIGKEFDQVICRPFPLEPFNTYYSRYFQWKVDTITAKKPTLVFDDDQQICKALLMKGISALWLPQYTYMPKITEMT